MARVCAVPGCPELSDGTHCPAHKRERQQRKRTQRSDRARKGQKLYTSKGWKRRRDKQVRRQPYCECPEHKGKRVLAELLGGAIADHVEPHGYDPRKFWAGELMTLGKRCHDSWKQRYERGNGG